MFAAVIPSAVSVSEHGTLPNGVGFLYLPYDGTFDGFKDCPVALSFMGKSYVRCSHNSDTFKVCYRTDYTAAHVVR